jgi:Na+/H+ antiporter NhaD/arsenite permease-like protein
MSHLFPVWTMLPFGALVLCIAALPLLVPGAWGKHGFQAFVALGCAAPVVAFLLIDGHREHLWSATTAYLSFVATVGALYVTASGIFVAGDIEAKPRTNLVLLVVGALLASVIGTTGASILMIRPLLRTNSQRVMSHI